MAIKVLVNALGQHIVAEVKQVENKETQELVGYWLENPRLVNYTPRTEEEGGGVNVGFGPLCPLSDEQAYSVRAEHIVSILEPRSDVVGSYNALVAPPPAAAEDGSEETVEAQEPPVDEVPVEEAEEACEECESGDEALAAAEAVWRTVGSAEACDLKAEFPIGRGAPGDIAADKEVEQGVAIIIEETCRSTPGQRFTTFRKCVSSLIGRPATGATNTCLSGDVDKSSATVGSRNIVVEDVAADPGDKQIGPAIIVHVADDRRHAIEALRQSRVSCDILEFPITLIRIQAERV